MKDHRIRSTTSVQRSATSEAGVGKRTLVESVQRRKIQQNKADAAVAEDPTQVQEAAASGVAGSGGALPHGDAIQRSFGKHDVSGVKAHTDDKAAVAAGAMGAEAYATGNDVAFGGAPSLHTAAHEAAHTVQQKEGVQLAGGVGAVGDSYEQHADAVADAVVAGESAEGLLDAGPSGGGGAVQRLVQRNPDPGKTGGKVSLDDFSGHVGADQVAAGGAQVTAANQMTLEQMKAKLGKPQELAPRSTDEMLAAIKSGVLPRWVARVGAKANFDAGSFGYASSNQVFATEPADVLGLSAAQALVKVGWTPDQLGGQVGKEIAVCCFDTLAPVKDETGVEHKPGVQEMNWDTLEVVAKDPTKNAWFHTQLGKFTTPTASVTVAELPDMFALAKKTPVGAEPDSADPLVKEKYKIFRQALGGGVAASELFSGMGATVSETGKLGAREVMITNEGSKFKLTPDNHVVHSLGVLQKSDVDALIAPQPAPPAPNAAAPT